MDRWLRPRALFACIMYFTFAYLTIHGKIEANTFVNVFLVITGFYFGERNKKNEKG